MKFLLDTSILVAALVETHPKHSVSFPWLERAREGVDTGFIGAHSLAEVYSILTTLPTRPRISSQAAQRMIDTNLVGVFQVIELSQIDYQNVIRHLSQVGIIGGAVYDGLLLYAASKAQADQIVTLNTRDFSRIYPDLAGRIVTPS